MRETEAFRLAAVEDLAAAIGEAIDAAEATLAGSPHRRQVIAGAIVLAIRRRPGPPLAAYVADVLRTA